MKNILTALKLLPIWKPADRPRPAALQALCTLCSEITVPTTAAVLPAHLTVIILPDIPLAALPDILPVAVLISAICISISAVPGTAAAAATAQVTAAAEADIPLTEITAMAQATVTVPALATETAITAITTTAILIPAALPDIPRATMFMIFFLRFWAEVIVKAPRVQVQTTDP